MKVDVITPDDELQPQGQAQPGVDAEATEPVEEVEAEVIEPEEESGAEAEAEPVDEAQVAAAVDEVFSIADIENARAEAQAANERYMRLQAEWDNFRKRTAREREEEKSRAAEALVTKLLPVVDDLERSLDHAAKSAPEGEFGEFVGGIQAVYAKLIDVLDRTGVTAIDPAGKPFDMNENQAIAQVEDPTVPANTVRDVYQKGYRMGGRIIRTAMVTVTKGGPAQPAAASAEAAEQE